MKFRIICALFAVSLCAPSFADIVDDLQSSDESVSGSAARKLVDPSIELNGQDIDVLLKAATNGVLPARIRGLALQGLWIEAVSGRPGRLESITARLKRILPDLQRDSEPEIRVLATRLFSRFSPDEPSSSVRTLIATATNDADQDVRMAALRELGELGRRANSVDDQAIAGVLISVVVNHADRYDRSAAALALGKLQPTQQRLDTLIQALNKAESENEMQHIVIGLSYWGAFASPALPVLRALLVQENPRIGPGLFESTTNAIFNLGG